MRRAEYLLLTAILTAVMAGLVPVRASEAAGVPTHAIAVVGSGAVTFPAFSQDVDRYGVRPNQEGPASLTVNVSTSDPFGSVRVDGRLVTGGSATVSDVESGDEISVLVSDAGGLAAYSFIVLPHEFPLLQRTTAPDSRSTDGAVLLTLGKWISPGSFFETAVDKNGVPLYVRETSNSMDLQRQPNGHYSVARGGANGADVVELDEQFREVRRLRTRGLVHTDGHDTILNADGSAYLMAYEPDAATGLTDAVIQHISATGEVLFEWNSAEHVNIEAETVVGDNPDYAHVNSFQVMADGDLLVSFRHFSSVFKIARHAHDGFAVGDVVWRLGGRSSDFTFTDTTGNPDGGPCAQHTATELPNGDIMVFDNGAWNLEPLCINPADPSGPPVARIPTRISQWSIDEVAMSATMVKDVKVGPADGQRYAIFAGSAQPLQGGNTVVGWAAATQAVASELSPTGEVLWEIEAPESPKYFTYRAHKTQVPDAIGPEVAFAPGSDRTVVSVGDAEIPDLVCTDRGGSNLRSCIVSDLDTSSQGSATMTVVATDGAGNQTVARRDYTVIPTPPSPPVPSASPAPSAPSPSVPSSSATPTPQAGTPRRLPDLHVKAAGQKWTGVGVHDARRGQTVHSVMRSARSAYRIRLRNDGVVADRFRVRVYGTSTMSGPRWVSAGRESPQIDPGESVTFRIVVRRGRARVDTTRVVARSVAVRGARDRVWARTKWR